VKCFTQKTGKWVLIGKDRNCRITKTSKRCFHLLMLSTSGYQPIKALWSLHKAFMKPS
jgi:hypothetical protein